jgi:hypothetical protein
VTGIDLAILKCGLPASNLLLAFAMKVRFQAKLKWGCCSEIERWIMFLSSSISGVVWFSSLQMVKGEKGNLTDLARRNVAHHEKTN